MGSGWIRAGAAGLVFVAAGAALAQEPPLAPIEVETEIADALPEAAAEEAAPELNPDEMASQLNARQRIEQTYTLTRTLNGEVVEVDRRTVIFNPGDPVRPTEAGVTAVEELLAAFNNELLTRTEAFEEARLDFIAADVNRDGVLSEDEFVAMVDNWRSISERRLVTGDEESARERQYRAFIEELDPETAREDAAALARSKFAFMAGASQTLTREDYIREYLLDFDSMDVNGDGFLRGRELMMFRALNRGETLTSAAP